MPGRDDRGSGARARHICRSTASKQPLPPTPIAFLRVNEALDRLGDADARLLRVVECRFFAGFTEAETAGALSVSTKTVEREWQRAKAWLRSEIGTP